MGVTPRSRSPRVRPVESNPSSEISRSPAKTRGKPRGLFKLALFDLDGTLTRERSAWEFIHRRLGVWEGHAEKFQEAFLRGEIPYRRFCELDAQIWRGMKVSEVQRILREVPLYPGIEELLGYLRSKGIRLGIISSGLSLLCDWIKERYGFDYAVANELGETDGVLDGRIKIHVHYDRKGPWVSEAKRRFGARKFETLAIGDSAGDIPMFRMAGFSIAFNSHSPHLDAVASVSVQSLHLRDLISALVPYLGPEA
jgi:phosphoserine phosphatase